MLFVYLKNLWIGGQRRLTLFYRRSEFTVFIRLSAVFEFIVMRRLFQGGPYLKRSGKTTERERIEIYYFELEHW
jgi:hypothetical protein